MELDRSVNEGVKSVVLANSNVVTRIVLGATLANDDVAGDTLLTTINLNAKSLSC